MPARLTAVPTEPTMQRAFRRRLGPDRCHTSQGCGQVVVWRPSRAGLLAGCVTVIEKMRPKRRQWQSVFDVILSFAACQPGGTHSSRSAEPRTRDPYAQAFAMFARDGFARRVRAPRVQHKRRFPLPTQSPVLLHQVLGKHRRRLNTNRCDLNRRNPWTQYIRNRQPPARPPKERLDRQAEAQFFFPRAFFYTLVSVRCQVVGPDRQGRW